ncbi:hypothetical protein [Saprospira grandis]|nr:hypothetical protein [Saprospira grandis]WBM74216.1 hypothetical protein OP864_14605 [Saprospira grandis]
MFAGKWEKIGSKKKTTKPKPPKKKAQRKKIDERPSDAKGGGEAADQGR